MTTLQIIALTIGGCMIALGLWKWARFRLVRINTETTGGCNVCGEPLHKGCCNPNHGTVGGIFRGASPFWKNAVTDDAGAPLALTESQLVKLEQAIRREGYDILTDPENGDVVLKLNQRFAVQGGFALATCPSSLPIIARVVSPSTEN